MTTQISRRLWVCFWAALLLPCASAAANLAHHQSIDLVKYGFHNGKRGDPYDYTSSASVAASKTVVALALQNLSPDSRITKPNGYDKVPWDVSLLFFDANSGKLMAKCGPWTGGLVFDLFATSQGRFVLHLTNLSTSRGSRKLTDALLLLSPSGALLKKLDLEPSTSELERLRHSDWGIVPSPSRDTLLVGQPLTIGHHYEILDANTLGKRAEWTDATNADPTVIAASDKTLLGIKKQSEPNISKGKNELFVRPLHGPWRPLLAVRHDWTLLTDNEVVGLEEVGAPSWGRGNSYRLLVVRTDGSNVLSREIRKKNEVFFGGWPIVTSADGSHFAAIISSQSVSWLWRTLDMGPGRSSLDVWAVPNPQPVLKLKVEDQFSSFDVSPDGSWLAVADQRTLKIVPIPPASER